MTTLHAIMINRTEKTAKQLFIWFKPRLHIHDFLYDSPRFLMVRKISMDRDESWREVEVFSVTTIPVRMSTI